MGVRQESEASASPAVGGRGASSIPAASASPSDEPKPALPRRAFLAAWERRPFLLGVALCAMVGVSYYPALLGGFIWDDLVITDTPMITVWSGLWDIWFSPTDIETERHYWPIMYTTFWLEHKLWGLEPFGYHLVNVLLHMVNVLLLWRLLGCLSVPGAWVVAAVFAVHPIHVEPVAWVIGRKDLLSCLFYMAAALCWIRAVGGIGDSRRGSRDSPVSRGHMRSRSLWQRTFDSIGVPRPGLYLAALGLFAAAMLSKSVAVTLPVAFVICLWWKQGRVTWKDASRIAPFFLVALCMVFAALTYYWSSRELSFDHGLTERVLIAARALWFYVGKLAWPTDLAVVYPLWNIDAADPLAWGYLIAAAAVAALLWFGRHRLGRAPFAGAVFFAVTLSPMLGFLDFSFMAFAFVAERYAYLACVGVMAVPVAVAARGASKLPNLLKIGAAGILVAVLAVFARMTWEQAGIYRDEISFYTHIISLNPSANFMHYNFALALNDAERPAEALAAGRVAVERHPDFASAHNAVGSALYRLNRLDEAEESYLRALELDSNHRDASQNMADIRRSQGRFAESIKWYRRVLDIDPEFAKAHAGMGRALYYLERYEQAGESLAQAVSLRPDAMPISTFHLLAEALREQQRYEEAIERYRNVLDVDPEHGPAHAGMGYALLSSKRHREAVESLARSISLEPDASDAADRHVALGRAFMGLGRTEAAAENMERALEIDSRNATALDSLALLRFQQQRYDEALRLYETLIEVGAANAQTHVNMGATLYHLDRPAEALRSLDRALSLDPDLVRTGFNEDALTKMRDMLGRQPQ